MSIKNRRFAGARLLAEPFEDVTDLLQKLKTNPVPSPDPSAGQYGFDDAFSVNGKNVRLSASNIGVWPQVDLTDGKQYLGNRKTYELLSESPQSQVYSLAWDVDGSYGSGPIKPGDEKDRKERLMIAREVQRRYRDLIRKMPEGSIVTNSPVGASSGDFGRADLYMAQGFGPVQSNNSQYGIVRDGKIQPLSPMLPSEDHARHLANRTRMAGDVGLSDKMLIELSGNAKLAERVYSPDDNAEFASATKQGGYGGAYDDDDFDYYEDTEPPIDIQRFRDKDLETRGIRRGDREADQSEGHRPFDEISRRYDAERALTTGGIRVPREDNPNLADIVYRPYEAVGYGATRDYTPGEESRIDPALVQEMRDFQVRAALEQQPGGSLAKDPRVVMMRALDASTPRALPTRIDVADLEQMRGRGRRRRQIEEYAPGERLAAIAADLRGAIVRDTGDGIPSEPPLKSRNIDTDSYVISRDPAAANAGRQAYVRQEAFSPEEIAEGRALQEQLAASGAYTLRPNRFQYPGTAADGYTRPFDEPRVNFQSMFSSAAGDYQGRGRYQVPIGNSGRSIPGYSQTEEDRMRLAINDGAPVRDRRFGATSNTESALESELGELLARQSGNSEDMANAQQTVRWFERFRPGYANEVIRANPMTEPMPPRRLSGVLRSGATQPGRFDDEVVGRALNQLYADSSTDNSQRISELTERLGTSYRDPVARPVRRQMFEPDQFEMEVPGVGTLRRPNSPRNFILEALEANGAQLDAPQRFSRWGMNNRPTISQQVAEIDTNDPFARPVGSPPRRRAPRRPLATDATYIDEAPAF